MELAIILDDSTVLHHPILIKREKISNGICPQCDRQFCDSSTALRHLKHVHATPIPCKYCGKSLKVLGRPEVIKNHYSKCDIFLKSIGNKDINRCTVEQARKDYEKVKVGYKRLLSK